MVYLDIREAVDADERELALVDYIVVVDGEFLVEELRRRSADLIDVLCSNDIRNALGKIPLTLRINFLYIY